MGFHPIINYSEEDLQLCTEPRPRTLGWKDRRQFQFIPRLLKVLTVLHKLDGQVKISEKRGLPLCLTNPTFGRPCGQPSETQARRA